MECQTVTHLYALRSILSEKAIRDLFMPKGAMFRFIFNSRSYPPPFNVPLERLPVSVVEWHLRNCNGRLID